MATEFARGQSHTTCSGEVEFWEHSQTTDPIVNTFDKHWHIFLEEATSQYAGKYELA